MGRNTDTQDALRTDLRASLNRDHPRVEISALTSMAYPDLVLLDSDRGLIAIDVLDSVGADARSEFVELNRRIDALRADLNTDEDLPIARVLAVTSGLSDPTPSVAKRVLVPTSQLNDLRWLDLIDKQALDHNTLDEARAALFPSIVFTGQLRRGISDEGAEDRAALRVVLDQ